MEALDLSDLNLLEVNKSRVAEDLSEEVLPFLIIEKEDLSAVVLSGSVIAVLVDPLEEESLVWVEVWLLHKCLPQVVDVVGSQGDGSLGAEDKILEEAKQTVKCGFVSVLPSENEVADIFRESLLLFSEWPHLFFDSLMICLDVLDDFADKAKLFFQGNNNWNDC